MHEQDSFFDHLFCQNPRFLAEKLLGEAVVAKNLQYFNEPPVLGQATTPEARSTNRKRWHARSSPEI